MKKKKHELREGELRQRGLWRNFSWLTRGGEIKTTWTILNEVADITNFIKALNERT
jgi:hypothetical protein